MLVLGAVTLLFIVFSEPIMSVFTPGFDDQPALQDLTVQLSRLMFPIVLLLALSGVVVGMLGCFLVGLIWIVVFYFIGSNSSVPVMNDLGQYNLLVGIGFMAVGFTFATKWE